MDLGCFFQCNIAYWWHILQNMKTTHRYIYCLMNIITHKDRKVLIGLETLTNNTLAYNKVASFCFILTIYAKCPYGMKQYLLNQVTQCSETSLLPEKFILVL